jgi:hypothetical protein
MKTMVRSRKATVAIAGAALLCLGAYASLSYLISPAVQDSGGGHAESGGYEIDCSIGGAVHAGGVEPGKAASNSYTLEVATTALVRDDSPASGGGGGGGGGDGGGCNPSPGGAALPSLVPLLGALWLVRRWPFR